jgi:hypothetical protein
MTGRTWTHPDVQFAGRVFVAHEAMLAEFLGGAS